MTTTMTTTRTRMHRSLSLRRPPRALVHLAPHRAHPRYPRARPPFLRGDGTRLRAHLQAHLPPARPDPLPHRRALHVAPARALRAHRRDKGTIIHAGARQAARHHLGRTHERDLPHALHEHHRRLRRRALHLPPRAPRRVEPRDVPASTRLCPCPCTRLPGDAI
ncbi:hypothetical protein EVG20_g10291 [Dentipellis fragilis]|uniref:Uncharacterized protein n=1 Tax=Dentipellis fragilis TaxID=205917 RepID=A0A4Y9XV68_9AGAM|nr:hypothetical protein EVG20_g10291 [Dentipellis fragilis]